MASSYEKVSIDISLDDRLPDENSPMSLKTVKAIDDELVLTTSPIQGSYLSSNQSSDFTSQHNLTPKISRGDGSPIPNTPILSQTKRSLLYHSDDEDEDLGRYSVQFRRTLNGSAYEFQHLENGLSIGKWNTPSEPMTNPVKRLFRNIQDARLESRRKRLEKLISLPDKYWQSYMGRCCVYLGTLCDLDKGLVIFLVTLVCFVAIITALDKDEIVMKRIMLGVGVPLFILRITWRPIQNFLCTLRYQAQGSSMNQHSVTRIPIV